jgi:hypothetical protein
VAIAATLAIFAVITFSSAARAQSLPAENKAACQAKLDQVEPLLDSDAKYARDWTSAWLVTGGALVALNLTKAFQVDDYRRGESLVFAASSTLLMIQQPVALTTRSALKGLRSSQDQDPCFALVQTRYMLETNADDGDLHRNLFPHVFGITLNLLTGALLAVATGHWDFAGHGSEGLSTLVGIGAGELQVLTYPRGALRASSNSLTLSF